MAKLETDKLSTFLPDKPTLSNKIGRAISEGVEIDIPFYWSYKTKDTYLPNMVNSGCYDVSKTRVDRVFRRVSGYSTFVTSGKCVEKSDKQWTHDGIILDNPRWQEGKVYQKLLDNIEGEYAVDYRIFYFNGDMFAVAKKKAKDNRFGDNTLTSEPHTLSKDTKQLIHDFSQAFGLDIGEIDLLYDDKPYIIDVNNCAGVGALRNLPDHWELYKKLLEQSIRQIGKNMV